VTDDISLNLRDVVYKRSAKLSADPASMYSPPPILRAITRL